MFTHIIYLLLQLSILVDYQPMLYQDLKYDIFKNKKKVGEFTLQKTEKEKSVSIKVSSTTRFWLFGKKEMLYTLENSFQSGVLQSAFTESWINKKMIHQTETRKDGDFYILADHHKSKTDRLEQSSIHYTVGMMYFQQPGQTRSVYSERFLNFIEIRKISEDLYELTLPNGRSNYYRYVNGVAHDIKIDHPLVTIEFKLADRSRSFEKSKKTL